MCQLLLMANDVINADPVVNNQACYKKDDIIVVMPDDHQWGIGELDQSTFTIVSLPGVPVGDFESALLPENTFINGSAMVRIGTFRHHLFKKHLMKSVKRRKYTFNRTTSKIERKT